MYQFNHKKLNETATWIPSERQNSGPLFRKKWISKLYRSNIILSLPSEFKSETIKSSILQLLHGCTSQSLRTSDNKQLVHFSPPRQDLSFPCHHLYSHLSSHDLSSHLSACIWLVYWDVSLFTQCLYGRGWGPKKHNLPIMLLTFLTSDSKLWTWS